MVIALAFCILVFYLITTLKNANRSLHQLQVTVSNLEQQVEGLGKESVKLVQTANQITEDVHTKMQTLDHLFKSVSDVGEAIQEVTSSVKQVSTSFSNRLSDKVNRSVVSHEQAVSELIQWTTLTMGYAQRIINQFKMKER